MGLQIEIPDLGLLTDAEEGANAVDVRGAVVGTLAAMTFPRDTELRQRFVAAVTAIPAAGAIRSITSEQAQRANPAVVIRLAQLALGGSDFFESAEVRSAERNGEGVVGPALNFILTMRSVRPDLANLTTAASLRAQISGREKKRGHSQRSFDVLWKEMRPAAHLWAAAVASRNSLRDGKLGTFFGIAEWFRIEGEGYRPPHSKEPLLRSSESWLPPEGVEVAPTEPPILRSEMFRQIGRQIAEARGTKGSTLDQLCSALRPA